MRSNHRHRQQHEHQDSTHTLSTFFQTRDSFSCHSLLYVKFNSSHHGLGSRALSSLMDWDPFADPADTAESEAQSVSKEALLRSWTIRYVTIL